METGNRIGSLDSIRGLAALSVVVFHYVHFATPGKRPFDELLSPIYHYGLYAVPLFFILSGAVLYATYADRLAHREISITEFAIRRFSRLYPAHVITLLVVAGLQFLVVMSTDSPFVYKENDFQHFLLNLVMMQFAWIPTGFSFNGPAWSIAVEAALYITFAAMVMSFGPSLLVASTMAGICTLLYFLPPLSWYAPFNPFMMNGFACFFIGGALERAMRSPSGREVANWIAFLGVVVGIYLLHFSVGVALTFFLFPATIIVCLGEWRGLGAVAPLRWLGTISYSIYLWHFPVQLCFVLFGTWITKIEFSFSSTFTTYVATVLLVGAASYYWLERPAMEYLRRVVKPQFARA